MKAISIRQPWAWLIVNGFKDIENRTWDTKYRGPVLIHASSRKPTVAEVQAARAILLQTHGLAAAHFMPSADDFCLGGIVGIATITGTCESSKSPWFFGPKGFNLADAQTLRFYPMKGKLSFFETGLRKHGVFGFIVPEEYRDVAEGTL